MFVKAALLIIVGILCLIMTVIALILGVIAFANNKQNKYIWLTTFLCSVIGLVLSIFMFVRKAVNTVQNFTENTIGQIENFGDSLSKIESIDTHQANTSSSQITLLKSYLPAKNLNPAAYYR